MAEPVPNPAGEQQPGRVPFPVQRVAPAWEPPVPDAVADETANVRPYTVTGGRTRSGSGDLPIEALVECLGDAGAQHAAESRRILELTAGDYLSVAELSAHLHLPVGVVRVLACDLADEGLVRVHGLTTTESHPPATTLSVLESVLNGISAL